jgi:hypothetical protein
MDSIFDRTPKFRTRFSGPELPGRSFDEGFVRTRALKKISRRMVLDDKLCSLNRLVTDSNRVHLAYAECRAIAASKPEAQ